MNDKLVVIEYQLIFYILNFVIYYREKKKIGYTIFVLKEFPPNFMKEFSALAIADLDIEKDSYRHSHSLWTWDRDNIL